MIRHNSKIRYCVSRNFSLIIFFNYIRHKVSISLTISGTIRNITLRAHRCNYVLVGQNTSGHESPRISPSAEEASGNWVSK